MLVKDARSALEALLARYGDELPARTRRTWIRILNHISRFDERTIDEVLEMLALAERPERARRRPDAASIAARLRAVLMNDGAFAAELANVKADRSVTKALLAQVYKQLYQRTGGIRASAPRAEILQLIADERLILMRHGTLSALLAPREAAPQ
jgi:hypothetical protein